MDEPSYELYRHTPARVEITARHRLYWRKNMALTITLTVIWAVISFVVPFFATELNAYTLLDFPLGFFMASLGSLIGYVALTGFYAWRMNRLDRQFGVSEEDDVEFLP